MNALDAGKLALIVATPTLVGAAIIYAPRICAFVAAHWESSRPAPLLPFGLPIEQLAADLRRLLRLHSELVASAHLAMRAHRLWAVEAAIAVRAVEAARALDVPHREPAVPGDLTRTELSDLLRALASAGLVLPATAGPFVGPA